MPTVAIGVHVHAEPEQLRATIESVQANTSLPFVLLLLPDGADHEVISALADFSHLRQLPTDDACGVAACFNRLAKNTDADILVLLESGACTAPGWLEHLLRAMDSNPRFGLAGPTTNRSWNEQGVFAGAAGDPPAIASTAAEAVQRFGLTQRTLEPLYSLADFCYVVRREVLNAVGEADESYGLGPCWEMDYNIRAARAGFQGVWACASYVYRAPFTARRQREETLRFDASRRRFQDKFCGLRLQGRKADYRSHCRGDACQNFAPLSFIMPQTVQLAANISWSEIKTPPAAANGGPLVSCIMPTYNRRDFLPRAFECFLRQDYPNLELIVVDDGNDGIKDMLPGDPRVRYFHLPQKLTIGAKRNYACERAQGEIVMHWDDDDWYAVERVRRQVNAMAESGADVSGTSQLYYYEPGTGKAFLYRYEGGPRAWVAGNTLAYRRNFWLHHRFPDVQVAEDSRFIWSSPGVSIQDLKDPVLCVATIHAANASPKYTVGAYWNPCPPERVLALLSVPASPLRDPVTSLAEQIVSLGGVADDPARYPLISCVMPTFNRRPFIPLALECFRAQTYPRKELVVIDDGTDPVADLLEGVPDIRYRRLVRRLTIGAKRNLACQEAQGEFIAHWDDDDWYAPNRLELQVAPLLAGTADLTGFANKFVLEMPRGQFWTTADELHRRMFVGDVHGGTLLYRKSILKENIRYPETNLAEDAVLIQQAMRRAKRLARLENTGAFVYLRHGRNAWKFEAGQFLDPAGWNRTTAPLGFSSHTLDLYRAAVESFQRTM